MDDLVAPSRGKAAVHSKLGSMGTKLPPQEMRAEISGKKLSRRPITRYSRVPRSSISSMAEKTAFMLLCEWISA